MVERRKFSPEFKAEAVRLVKERGVTQAQAARDLGIHLTVLGKWVRKAGPTPKAPAMMMRDTEPGEVVRLRREVAQLRAERDLLKKAAAYFAKEAT